MDMAVDAIVSTYARTPAIRARPDVPTACAELLERLPPHSVAGEEVAPATGCSRVAVHCSRWARKGMLSSRCNKLRQCCRHSLHRLASTAAAGVRVLGPVHSIHGPAARCALTAFLLCTICATCMLGTAVLARQPRECLRPFAYRNTCQLDQDLHCAGPLLPPVRAVPGGPGEQAADAAAA